MASQQDDEIDKTDHSSALKKDDADNASNDALILKVFQNVDHLRKVVSTIQDVTTDLEKKNEGEDLTKKYYPQLQRRNAVLTNKTEELYEKAKSLQNEQEQEREHMRDYFVKIGTDISDMYKQVSEIEKKYLTDVSDNYNYKPYAAYNKESSAQQDEISQNKNSSSADLSLVEQPEGTGDDSIPAKNSMNSTYVVERPLLKDAGASSSSANADCPSGELQSSKQRKGALDFKIVIPPPVPLRSQTMRDLVAGQKQLEAIEENEETPKTSDFMRNLQRMAELRDYEYKKLPQNVVDRFSLTRINSLVRELNNVLMMKDLEPGAGLIMSGDEIKDAIPNLDDVESSMFMYTLTKTSRLCDKNQNGLYHVRMLFSIFETPATDHGPKAK